MTAATFTHHHSQQQHASSSSSSRSLHSQVQDAVSITRDRLHEVVSSFKPPSESMTTTSSARGYAGFPSVAAAGGGGLKESWDALVKIMFAPCVNIGGVPREDMEGATTETSTANYYSTRHRLRGGGGLLLAAAGRGGATTSSGMDGNGGGWGASVPFEVSASSLLGQSLVMSSSSLDDQTFTEQQEQLTTTATAVNPSTPQQLKKQQRQDPPGATTTSSSSLWEQRKALSRDKLRQLGARHRLANGFPDENLADVARPITPGQDEEEVEATFHHHTLPTTSSSSPQQQQQSELVDFDDGISAISSHTLEEMERRRSAKEQRVASAKTMTTVLRLHPLDFSQIIDEDCEWNNGRETTTTDTALRREQYSHHPEGGRLDVVEEVDETEVVFGAPFYEEKLLHTNAAVTVTSSSPLVLNRVPSTRTHQTLNTTVTEDTHEFEDMCQRHEALYWTNQDQVASLERSSACLRARPNQDHRDRSSSGGGRMSIEERARRLRELSRSRSRSDGSGSSNKSGTSSLISGQHPHDIIPLYSFDLFPTPSWRKSSNSLKSGTTSSRSGSGSKAKMAPGRNRRNCSVPDVVSKEGSDPFDMLECSEI